MGFDFKKWIREGLEERNIARHSEEDFVVTMETDMRKDLVKMVQSLTESVEAEIQESEDLNEETEEAEVCETCEKQPCECVMEAIEEDGEDGATGTASVEMPGNKRKRQLDKIKGKFKKKSLSKHPDSVSEKKK